ncbi:MAG: N-acetylmuramoyl-L-alanine amidase [Lachnospiraceae bacterium]|nr:N-acetylmuramoyl-L-alanine amidase [Lachnospiraceae bacterium]
MEIVESILTQNFCYRAGKKIVVKGLMLHSVGCPQPSAEVFVKKWNRSDAARACVHAFIDGNTGKVYQTLPWNHRAWHCGGSANNTHIGVEMCEPACLRYLSGANFNCSNKETAMEVVKRTYDVAVELFASLCKQFQLDPLKDGVIVSHKEGHERGIASGHGDPEHLWSGLQSNYTMDGFRRDVSIAMKKESLPVSDNETMKQEALSVSDNETSKARGIAEDGVSVAKSMPHKQAGQSARQEREISVRGLELIARYEGCRLEAYKCPAGVWTIGYGHTKGVCQGDRLPSKEAAMELLKEDLKKYSGYVNELVVKGIIIFCPTQDQFDALTSFCYNCGKGNLQKLVANRDAATIADKLLLYNKGGGKVLQGLVRRRQEERNLFLGNI